MKVKNNIVMKKIKSLLLALATLFLCLFPASCVKNDVQSDTEYGYFGGTYFTLYDYSGMKKSEFQSLFSALHQRLEYYGRLFDIYYEYSGVNNLKTVNLRAGEAVSVPPEIIDLIEFSKEVYEITLGEVNIAFGAVLSLWHAAREAGNYIPEVAQLRSAAEHCNIDDVIIDRENSTVRLADPEMSLDVGAVAKGYAVELLAEYAESLGATSLVIDVGGNMRTVGEHPDGGGWRVHIQNPDLSSKNAYITTLENVKGAAVTSGDYQRYFVYQGEKYNHIIDKDTLMPAKHFASVSVVCSDSGLGDALSTALFAMPLGNAWVLLQELPEVSEAVFINREGQIFRYTAEQSPR